MVTQGVTCIVPGPDSSRRDEPHVDGSRVTGRNVHCQVEHRGVPPEPDTDEHELDLADVYAALTYYHSTPEERHSVERENALERPTSPKTARV